MILKNSGCLLYKKNITNVLKKLMSNKPKDKKCPEEKTSKLDVKEKTPKLKTFEIYRYQPKDERHKKPYKQKYTIDLNDCQPTILDALVKIKVEQDSTLAFRRSCREGICGSCAMNVDGINRLACLHKIKPGGVCKILPLPHMYVIKDLIVDFKKFLQQHDRIKPYLIKKDTCAPFGEEQYLQSPKDRDLLDKHIECILCACCSTSCPEYWWHGHSKAPNDFLGPAALLNAYRWLLDTRDEGTEERLEILKNYYAVYRCHVIMNCTSVCPKRLNPGRAISNLRHLLVGFQKKKDGEMKGTAPGEPMKACCAEK